MMTIRVETEYSNWHRSGAGFYNTVIFDETKLTGRMTVGPYASRPMARKDAVRLMSIMAKEQQA